jgi:hypothetical protein
MNYFSAKGMKIFEKAVKDMIKENEKCKRDEKHKSSKYKYNNKKII